ncbi:hypothetical protein CYMTET_21451 [Cymbomonas tetramitiformis]|uniref:MD-2-related lipid-recognition domain-containing protein n=1 Tax=Cymbomonas tetramitiformis TaxID=36881 RepID=A0AAE0L361_9CHLO|nr:hypothetical protein CYMTET_21451 [Cymbomonas tetramitiformis]
MQRITLLLGLLAFANADSIPFTSCGGDGSLTASSIDITPYPAEEGKTVDITIAANTKEQITDGKIDLELSLFGVKVFTVKDDVCKEATCPVAIGDFNLKTSQPLPSLGVSATIGVKAVITDQNSKEVGCFQLELKVEKAQTMFEKTKNALGFGRKGLFGR